LAKIGQKINEPKDIIKNIYTLDFLNIEDKTNYSENQLKEKIINEDK
jgi:predicted nuclease of restriction endonuclease-like (RecB) superfamily